MKTKQFKRRKEADAFRKRIERAKDDGTHVAGTSTTISAMSDIWIKAVENGRGTKGPAEAATLRNYRQQLRDYILPALGNIKLTELSRSRVIRWSEELMEETGGKAPTVNRALVCLKGIIAEAMHRDFLKVNVAAGVTVCAPHDDDDEDENEKAVCVSRDDARALLRTLDELSAGNGAQAVRWAFWRAYVALAFHSGLRASELRGLGWESVDLQAGVVHVRKSAKENGSITSKLKSKAARRSVRIPASLVALLTAHKARVGGEGLLFPTRTGKALSHSNFVSRTWRPLQILAGVCDDDSPRYKFHSCRHFHASQLIASGANHKEIQVEMGHADIGTTFNVYGSLFRDDESDARATMRAESMAASW